MCHEKYCKIVLVRSGIHCIGSVSDPLNKLLQTVAFPLYISALLSSHVQKLYHLAGQVLYRNRITYICVSGNLFRQSFCSGSKRDPVKCKRGPENFGGPILRRHLDNCRELAHSLNKRNEWKLLAGKFIG